MKQNSVLHIVLSAFLFAGCSGGNAPVQSPATVAPTVAPTAAPTAAPTPSPTPVPTATPTTTPQATPKATATPQPTALPTEAPEAVASPLPTPEPFTPEPITNNGLPNKTLSWYFGKIVDHQPPNPQPGVDLSLHSAYYLGDTSEKNFYLTFDEGYENGYTPLILDVLREKNVSAAFFVTKPYLTSQPELILRMVEEGHLVCNHSVNHPSMPDKSDAELEYEILGVAEAFYELTGQEMPRFFRPPMGEYSQRTLDLTSQLGYKTIFWSFAHQDWLVNDQPAPEVTYARVMDTLHNGEIALLHAVSSSNTEALADIIDAIRAEGFEFKTLYELD